MAGPERPALFRALALAGLLIFGTGSLTSAVGEKLPLPFTVDAYPSTYRPLPREDTLIVHATVLDGRGHRLDDADILLRDGRVAALGAHLTPPAGAKVIEARGAWVTPGIVDPHSHLGDFAAPYVSADLQHSDVNEATDPDTAQVWAEHSITVQDPQFSRALAGGVTTLQILPGSSNLFGGRSVVLKNVPATTVQAMKFPGAPQGLKMACGENPKYTYGDKDRFPSSRMGDIAGDREAWVKAQDYQRKWLAYERGESATPPDRDLRLDTLVGVLRGDLRVHVHCYRADDMATMLGVAHEFGYHITAFHHAVEAYKIPDLLLKDDVCAVVWSDWWGYKMEALDAIRENAAFLDAAGVCVTMHSDSAVIGQRLTIEAAKAMAAGRRAGLQITPEHAIEWVTYNPAKILGLESQIGSLEVGKNADVVVWSGDPFSIYSQARQVFIDGALVYARTDPQRRPVDDFELGQPSQGSTP
jgi:imidazolonepropionase-like amidohydrolase